MNNLPAGVTQKMIDNQHVNWDAPNYCECGNIAVRKCCNCGEPICEEHSYSWNEGEYWCVDCFYDA